MKSTIGAIHVLLLLCALGCGSRDISSEGKILHLIIRRPTQHTTSADFRNAEDAFRAIPSNVPTMERFEWGRIDGDGDSPECYYLLILLDETNSKSGSAYSEGMREAMREVMDIDEKGRRFTAGDGWKYLFHDATPHVRTTTDGQLRHMVSVTVPTASREPMLEFENALVALPNESSAIERLEWGRRKVDGEGKFEEYRVLFTFADTEARDTCLTHPAYKEFRSFWEENYKRKPYVGWEPKSHAHDFISRVEYIAP